MVQAGALPGSGGHKVDVLGGSNFDDSADLIRGVGKNDHIRKPFMNRHVPGKTDAVNQAGMDISLSNDVFDFFDIPHLKLLPKNKVQCSTFYVQSYCYQ